MKTHGVYISFAVLIESAALGLACLGVGLSAAVLPGVVLWLELALLLAAAVLYGWRLWSLRGGHSYGLWELDDEREVTQ